MSVLEARDIAFGYGRANVWEHVSLALEAGEVTLLVGENGAGKSTLLRCLAGWEHLRTGEISFEGTPLERLRPARPRLRRDPGRRALPHRARGLRDTHELPSRARDARANAPASCLTAHRVRAHASYTY